MKNSTLMTIFAKIMWKWELELKFKKKKSHWTENVNNYYEKRFLERGNSSYNSWSDVQMRERKEDCIHYPERQLKQASEDICSAKKELNSIYTCKKYKVT